MKRNQIWKGTKRHVYFQNLFLFTGKRDKGGKKEKYKKMLQESDQT